MSSLFNGAGFFPEVIRFAAKGKTFLMPAQKSTFAGDVDGLFYFIYWISIFFFVLILGLLILFLMKYKRGKGREAEETAQHSTSLELVWSVIPFLLVIVIFVMGFRGFINMHTPPDNAYEVRVHGQKWSWAFTYPNGYVDSELHVPVNTPIKITLSAEDVLHSFFVPDFRVKRDAVPGRYTVCWFEAMEAGESPIYCAEYCGTGHSEMLSKVIVHEPGGFEKWLETAADFIKTMPPEEAGKVVYTKRGCGQCHSIDGTAGIGPTFKGLYGISQPIVGGASVPVDDNFIRESILQPAAKVAAGYDPVMPTFQGRIKNAEIDVLIAYIKSLK